MNILKKIYYKLPGTGSYYTQKALIWRNRGDSYEDVIWRLLDGADE